MEHNEQFLKEFQEILARNGYSDHFDQDSSNKVRVYARAVYMVKVENEKKNVIQVFLLMKDDYRKKHRSYPIWKKFHQVIGDTISGVEVNPACFIASKDENGKGDWHIYSAGDSSDEKDFKEIVNYEKAAIRFSLREKAAFSMVKKLKIIKWTSWVTAAVLITYLSLHIIFSPSMFPLDNGAVALAGVIAALLLLPLIFPFIKSVSAHGIDVNFE